MVRVKITPIEPRDIDGVVNCIQLAFESDPYNNWAFDRRPGKFNAARNYASLKAKCEWGMKHALFYVAKEQVGSSSTEADRVVGVSMWMKPCQVNDAAETVSWSAWFDSYVLWFKQGVNVLWYLGWGGLNTKRYWIWKKEQAVCQKEVWTDPEGYYFCNIVTVLPDMQGKGIGRELFEMVTNMADREGRKCYLESSRDEPNTAIYRRLGFELAKKMVCVDGNDKCDLFAMVREPQSKS